MTPLFLTAVAIASLALGPERGLTTPGRVAAVGSQSHIQIATSGTEILAIWRDDTTGRSGLYVSMMTKDGELIELTQRRLSEDVSSTPPRIVWTGTDYLVLWSPGNEIKAMTIDRHGDPVTPERSVLRGSLVASSVARIGSRIAFLAGRDLLMLDPSGNVVHTGPDMNAGAAVLGGHVATDGVSFYVFWNAWDNANRGNIYVRRFAPNGATLDATPVIVTPTLQGIREDWDVAFGSGAFAIAAAEHHDEERTLRPFLLKTATMQTTTLPPVSLGFASGTSVAWTGDRFVALWFQLDETRIARLHTMEIDPAGTSAAPVTQACAAHGFEMTELWSGAKLVTVFTVREPSSYDTDVYVAALTDWRGGAETCSAVAFSPTWQSSPAVATNGVQSLVAWTEGSDDGPVRIVIARTTSGLIDRAPIVLTENAVPIAPSVVYTGSAYVVVWIELTDERYPLVKMLIVSTDGPLLDHQPTELDYGISPSISWNGQVALVTWLNDSGIVAARLTRDGEELDRQLIAISGHPWAPLLTTSNGVDFLLVWPEGSDGEFPTPDLVDLYGARVDGSGAVLGSALPIATGPMDQRGHAIASDGRDYVVAYLEDERLVTKKVLREGVLSGSTAGDPGSVIGAPGALSSISLGSLNSGYAIAWEAESSTGFAVRLASLDRDGRATGTPTTVALSPIAGARPALALSSGRGDFLYALLKSDESYGEAMRLFTRRIGTDTTRARAVRH